MSQAITTRLPIERIGEIPTRPSPSKALVVSLASIMLMGLGLAALFLGPRGINLFLTENIEAGAFLQGNQTVAMARGCFLAFGVVGVLCGLSGLLSLVRSRITLSILRFTLVGVYVVVGLFVWTVWRGLFGVLHEELQIGGADQDRATILLLWWSICWPALAVALYVAWLHVMMSSRSVYSAFTKREGDAMAGDRVLEDVRSHGRDPQHRRSLYLSALTHITILILIPWILQLGGCVEAYRVPKGSGNPVVAMVKMVKPKKKKKKSLTLRPNSAIVYETPDLDNTEADEEMKEMTELTYEANPNAAVGQLGKGGGDQGGWPEGMDNYKIRFIRLDHGGAGWEDGMNQTGADINFLRHFSQVTGFKKIARKGESHSIALLDKYPDDGFPPFVYLTGNSRMGTVNSRDAKILREYCLKGGMLIGDAGSPAFHQSFTHLMRQVFPDKPLLDIADDDMIYQLPYTFPEGAPAFWGHGGRRALGIKHEGRWCVFYHPGDMNDAWKLPGYTDVTPEMRDAAMNLGVNLIRYSFDQWNDAVAKARK